MNYTISADLGNGDAGIMAFTHPTIGLIFIVKSHGFLSAARGGNQLFLELIRLFRNCLSLRISKRLFAIAAIMAIAVIIAITRAQIIGASKGLLSYFPVLGWVEMGAESILTVKHSYFLGNMLIICGFVKVIIPGDAHKRLRSRSRRRGRS